MKSKGYKRMAEVASAMAVVISLIFVGLEVRETARQAELNTEALRVAAYQDLISQIAQFNEVLLDPDLAELYARLTDPSETWGDFSETEQTQARRILFMIARHADMAFYQFEQGFLPHDRLESALAPFLVDLPMPIYSEFWAQTKGVFVPSFRDYIDSRLAGQDP